ncbi:MAG: phosphate ABC transporter permease [Cyanobacteria bacterium J083]|nr:MAG: phosphate ABC transporter permease [Cyanobacteria bacterium J083]
MLVPLTREKFEQIIPVIATGPQYAYYWGQVSDFLQRLLISFIAVIVCLLLGAILGKTLSLILSVIAGLYWLWSPIYLASLKNISYRKYKYSGFWRGKVLDLYITEEVVGEQKSANQRGELVVVENRERVLNLEIGDETGFFVEIKAPLKRIYKVIQPGATAELLVLSNQRDLSKIEQVTDAYLPRYNLWIGEYPWLRRDIFRDVSRELGGKRNNPPPSSRSNRYLNRPY